MDDTGRVLSPPWWSILTGDIGRYSVLLAAVFFVISVVAWALSTKVEAGRKIAAPSLVVGVVSLFVSFVSLGALFVGNRFEFTYVFDHGDARNGLAYRIAGIWSGQQGSFLLWACAAGLFALLTAPGAGPFRRWYSIVYGAFLATLAGILAFESPFVLNLLDGQVVVPSDGAGLAPSLQNYWVVIHPPVIFLGFGALTVMFAYAFAAMMERDYGGWIPRVRPWALVALSVLGLGLCMGGFWAYETLGWGGFWMWDPVENVSLVPWCLTAAFVHGAIVQSARGSKKSGNLLLAGLPFLSFVYGTFLTRSGLLSNASVHSFAEMNRSALQLLVGVMAVSTLAFASVWLTRTIQLRHERPAVQDAEATPALGRESLINWGIGAIGAIGLATLIGMSVPFIQALRHQPSRVVEEGLYHQVLTWFFVPFMVLMSIAPFARWRKASGRDLARRLNTIFSLAIGLSGLFLMGLVFTPFGKVVDQTPLVTLLGRHNVPGMAWLLFLVGLCALVLVGNGWRIWELRKRGRLNWAPFLAHIGVALLMIGLIVSRGFEQRDTLMVSRNQPGRALGYEFRYRGMTSNDSDRNNHLLLDVYRDDQPDKPLFTADPGLYKVPAGDGAENTMVWPAIVHRPLYDVYVALRPPEEQVSDPIELKPGEKKLFGGLVVQYNGLKTSGVPGQAGTTFAAELTVTAGKRVRHLQPSVQLGRTGSVFHAAPLDENFNIGLVSMNAADRSVALQFQMSNPIYPIDVFHKPLVALVWIGTGLMTFAGLLAAVSRRMPSVSMATADKKILSGANYETITVNRRPGKSRHGRVLDHG